MLYFVWCVLCVVVVVFSFKLTLMHLCLFNKSNTISIKYLAFLLEKWFSYQNICRLTELRSSLRSEDMTSSFYQLTLITGSRRTTNFNLSAVRTRLITELRHELTDNWFIHSTWNHFVSVLFIYWSFVRGYNNQLINQKITSATIFIIVFFLHKNVEYELLSASRLIIW